MEFSLVMAVTTVAVGTMIYFKDYVNRSEAMRAMEQLGQRIVRYRQENGSVPPESFVNNVRENVDGYVRLGKLTYRGLWIDFESAPDEILAYVEKDYHSWSLGKGCIVLSLDGRIQWLDKQQFLTLLKQQQSAEEIRMLGEN
jgi:hypothetical protein